MKIRHAVIISIILFIFSAFVFSSDYLPIDFRLQHTLINITGFLWLVSLGLIAYLIIRNIFRAITGAVTGTPQGGNYRAEARRACDRTTPKKDKYATPPWEE